MVSLVQLLLSVVSGTLVGFSLGLIGGGGSILAVPLFLYFVGLDRLPNAVHAAIGTTSLAVGINAYINLYMHLRRGNVAVRVGGVFTIFGLAGSIAGAYLGRITPGSYLLTYFAIAMVALGIYMAARREASAAGTNAEAKRISESMGKCPQLALNTLIKVGVLGFLVGLVSGYLGIGGGFLIVPALMFSAGLCIARAIGTSLLSVGAFGLASGLVYTLSGDSVVEVALSYVAGGMVGGYIGTSLSMEVPRRALRIAYGAIIAVVGIYILFRTHGA